MDSDELYLTSRRNFQSVQDPQTRIRLRRNRWLGRHNAELAFGGGLPFASKTLCQLQPSGPYALSLPALVRLLLPRFFSYR